jgi:hypothetical protein
MSRQLAHLIALGLADWFIDDSDDPRFYEINNIDPDRFGQCHDPFGLAATNEEQCDRFAFTVIVANNRPVPAFANRRAASDASADCAGGV